MKNTESWYSERLESDTHVVRWGTVGLPLLLFPTAGGDAEEVERFHLVDALSAFLESGRLKVYSVDSIAGRNWITDTSAAHRVWMQKQFDAFIRYEVAPLIRQDCQNDDIEIMTAGASIGAFNALLSICRHPDVFNRAICMSGTFDIQKWLEGGWFDDFYYLSPLHFVPRLPEGNQLSQLQTRFVVIPTGRGEYEDPDESWKVAHALGEKNIPNRVDLWGPEWKHDWVTWRAMLPKYVEEMLTSIQSETATAESS